MEIISAEQAAEEAKGLTFEKVWAALMDSRRLMDESQRRIEKNMDESQRRIEKNMEESRKDLNKIIYSL